MTELRTLLMLELRSLYGINRTLHDRDPKSRRRALGMGAAILLLILMVCAYAAALVAGLCMLGMPDIVPAYLAAIASVAIVAFGIFTAGHRIFGARGSELLFSMPLRPRSIVLARFLSLYVEDLLLTLLIFLPGVVTYGIFQRRERSSTASPPSGPSSFPSCPWCSRRSWAPWPRPSPHGCSARASCRRSSPCCWWWA